MATDKPVETTLPTQTPKPNALATTPSETEEERKKREVQEQIVPKNTLSLMSIGLVLLLLIMLVLFLLFISDGFVENDDVRLAVLVMLSGGLGAYIHAAHSFVTYIGTQEIKRSWLWWYFMRPFIGMSLALVFFLIYRANISGVERNDENEYLALSIAALVGMFSKQAIQKLGEIFDVVLRAKTGEELKQKDSLTSSNAKSTSATTANDNDANKPKEGVAAPTPETLNGNEPALQPVAIEENPNAQG